MRLAFVFAVALAGCAGGPAVPQWRLDALSALAAFERHYLRGETRLAELEFARAKSDLGASGRLDLLARAELVRCAARTASLDFDACPGFEALRRDAGLEELAYADYLAGKISRSPADDPLSRLVAAAMQFKSGGATPEVIRSAIDVASEQGWRRPLLAWLHVEAKRAEAAGDREALERIRRRIGLVSAER